MVQKIICEEKGLRVPLCIKKSFYIVINQVFLPGKYIFIFLHIQIEEIIFNSRTFAIWMLKNCCFKTSKIVLNLLRYI